jgi:hypothetical protein
MVPGAWGVRHKVWSRMIGIAGRHTADHVYDETDVVFEQTML